MKALVGLLIVVGIISVAAGIVSRLTGINIPAVEADPLSIVVFGNSCLLVALALNALKK